MFYGTKLRKCFHFDKLLCYFLKKNFFRRQIITIFEDEIQQKNAFNDKNNHYKPNL